MKTILRWTKIPVYEVPPQSGPSHAPSFTVFASDCVLFCLGKCRSTLCFELVLMLFGEEYTCSSAVLCSGALAMSILRTSEWDTVGEGL
jgi:hypothetical protein